MSVRISINSFLDRISCTTYVKYVSLSSERLHNSKASSTLVFDSWSSGYYISRSKPELIFREKLFTSVLFIYLVDSSPRNSRTAASKTFVCFDMQVIKLALLRQLKRRLSSLIIGFDMARTNHDCKVLQHIPFNFIDKSCLSTWAVKISQ